MILMKSDELIALVGVFLSALGRTRKLFFFEDMGNKTSRKSAGKLFYLLEEILFIEEEIKFHIVDSEIDYAGNRYSDIDRDLLELITLFEEIGSLEFTFVRGVTKDELFEFLSLTIKDPDKSDGYAGLIDGIKKAGIKKIILGEMNPKEKGEKGEVNAIKLGKEVYSAGGELLDEIEKNVIAHMPFDVDGVRDYINSLLRNLKTNKSSLLLLATVKSQIKFSLIHNINVAIFSILQAESLGFEKTELGDVGMAALFHDIGKLRIPAEMIEKETALTDEEFGIIKGHPIIGAKILLENPGVGIMPAIVAFEHHLRYDGGGYPHRKYKKAPMLISMIVSIADVYDALRSKRTYAGEMAPEKIYNEMMKMTGRKFNADLLDNFFGLIGVYPPGTIVSMDTGEIGMVVSPSIFDKRRPKVELLYNREGDMDYSGKTINLLERDDESGNFKRTILHSLIPTEKINVPNKYID